MPQQDDQTLAQKTAAPGQRETQPKNGNGEEESIESLPLYRNFKIVIPLFIVLFGLAFVTWQYYINERDFVTTDDAYIDGNRVSISAKILGRIDQLQVDEGDTVQEGEILVKLDDSDLRSEEVQAKASLALAQENITLAGVNLDKAQTDFERASTQFKDNIIPKEQYRPRKKRV